MVADVGENNIVQIIIDNGYNYKKACRYLTNEYRHITWQVCLAHIINLMLKTIGDFPDHESVIDSAKLISRWLYNHERIHTMIKNAIGGNLVRWNTTYFGMNYLFLKSFLRRKDHFIEWMATPQLQQSRYMNSNVEKYAHTLFHDNRTSFDQYMEIVNKRMYDVTNDTYTNVGKMKKYVSHLL
jgi:hypothetical protein